MILSGYGLTYCYKRNQLSLSIQSKRILKLYVHYWLILLIFVTIGHFIKPDIYPNNLINVLINIIGINCTYNGEIWFLLPYTIISMLSWWIINFVYNLNDKRKIFITLIVYSVIFLIARYIGYHLPKNEIIATLLIQLVYIVQLTFYFSLGILLFRLLENEPTALKAVKPTIYFIIIIVLFFIKSMIKVTIADGLYAFIIIFCISHLQLHKFFHYVFYKLGLNSMPMWMTHTFFAIYLFQNFIYGFSTMIIENFMLDYIMNRQRQSVQFMIFSKHHEDIARAISEQTDHTMTILDGSGWYSGKEMKVIVLLAKKSESVMIFRIIKMIDPKAFVSQSAVIGVYGEGFDKIKIKVNG